MARTNRKVRDAQKYTEEPQLPAQIEQLFAEIQSSTGATAPHSATTERASIVFTVST